MTVRKNYFIKSFQTGLVMKFVFLVLLESALIFGVFMFLAKNTITTGYSNSILTLNSSQEFFFAPFIGLCLIVSICVSISGLIALMFVSHRVAGPIYRFEKILETLNRGDLTANITLRKDDDCIELRNLLEDFVASLNRRVNKRGSIPRRGHLVPRGRIPGDSVPMTWAFHHVSRNGHSICRYPCQRRPWRR